MSHPAGKGQQPQAPIKVVVVEDEKWIRESLVREISQDQGLYCVNNYRSAEDALKGISKDSPDVVLMDINLPGIDGVECVRRIRTVIPDVRCLMLTVYEESEKIFNSLLAGASGYLLKRTDGAELLEAIRQVASGGSPMSSSIARKVVLYFNKLGKSQSNAIVLAPREQQVLELLAKGMAYKNIADELSVSLETIRMNIKHIYSKLHVHSRGEATVKYLQEPQFHGGKFKPGK